MTTLAWVVTLSIGPFIAAFLTLWASDKFDEYMERRKHNHVHNQ